jgi:hypothetical protein
METILIVNAGSSSLKFQVFALGILPDLKCLVEGQRPDSRVELYVIPTDEELMIARHKLSVLSRGAAPALVNETLHGDALLHESRSNRTPWVPSTCKLSLLKTL